jgi:hypothetical protein
MRAEKLRKFCGIAPDVGNFSINSEILILRFTPEILYSEAAYNFSINIDFLDFKLRTGVQFFK